MRPNDQDFNSEDEPKIPDRLKKDLQALYGSTVDIPFSADEAILEAARRRLKPRPAYIGRLRWAGAVAAAAVLTMAVALLLYEGYGRTRSTAKVVRKVSTDTPGGKDFNADGRIDILDAFTLARHIENTESRSRAGDINSDGVVDRSDVDLIAMAAVSLKGRIAR